MATTRKAPPPKKASAQKQAVALLQDETMAIRVLKLLASDRQAVQMTGPEDAERIFRPLLAGRENECFAVAAFNNRHRLIDVEIITTGSPQFVVVDPRQIYRWAMTRERTCHAIVVAHNHPSGDATPSPQDLEITRRIVAAGRVLGIPLLDHLVLADPEEWESLARMGEIAGSPSAGPSWTA